MPNSAVGWAGRITGVSPVRSALRLEVPQFRYCHAIRTGETPVIHRPHRSTYHTVLHSAEILRSKLHIAKWQIASNAPPCFSVSVVVLFAASIQLIADASGLRAFLGRPVI